MQKKLNILASATMPLIPVATRLVDMPKFKELNRSPTEELENKTLPEAGANQRIYEIWLFLQVAKNFKNLIFKKRIDLAIPYYQAELGVEGLADS